jgi:NTE family protein
MTKALVLSGGGSKGAYQIGVLKKWMGDQERDYEIMCGVSVGALNIAGLAMVQLGHPKIAIRWVEKFWLERVNTSAIYKRWFPFGRLHALWLKSVYDSSPLIELISDNIHIDKIVKNGRKLAIGAVCLNTGEYEYGRETDPDFVKWVLASSSFPVFLNPIEINGNLWSDGGIKHVTPLGQAVKMGATEIDVIMCSNLDEKTKFSPDKAAALPEIALRTVDIMSDQIIKSDIAITGLKNDLAVLNPMYRKIKVRVVMPKSNLIDNPLNFNPSDIKRMMEQGYKDADSAVDWI